MVFAVTLTKALDADITITTNIGSTTIKKGATSGKLIYTWHDDNQQEPNVVFNVLVDSSDYHGSYGTVIIAGRGTIIDDDRPPLDPDAKDQYDRAKDWAPPYDPLVLDLDGDGIETVGVNATTHILFDHNNDGIKTGTGWVNGDDGLLVLDRNGNGIIDNGSELFGDGTTVNGIKATDGFSALRFRHPERVSGSEGGERF